MLKRLARYTSVNIVCLPVNIGLAWLLTESGMHYVTATVMGYAAHVLLAFLLNFVWTFDQPVIHATKSIMYLAVIHSASFLIVIAVTAICVELIMLSFITARIIAMVIAGLWDYTLDSLFTFKPRN
jgi:putative flippase GtrA